jgi:hypothetical protein
MKAGRELDALVAEKVMGLTPTCPCPVCTPTYSTMILAAWQVVERMIGDGWNLHAAQVGANGGFTFFAKGDQVASTNVRGINPLSICLAALAACGVEVPE